MEKEKEKERNSAPPKKIRSSRSRSPKSRSRSPKRDSDQKQAKDRSRSPPPQSSPTAEGNVESTTCGTAAFLKNVKDMNWHEKSERYLSKFKEFLAAQKITQKAETLAERARGYLERSRIKEQEAKRAYNLAYTDYAGIPIPFHTPMLAFSLSLNLLLLVKY
jgi:hypothetical protein